MGHRSTGHLDDLGEPVAKIKAKKRQIEEERTWVSWRSSPNKESKIDEEKTKSLEAKNRKRASRGNVGRREGVQRRHEPNKNDLRASKARKTASSYWVPSTGPEATRGKLFSAKGIHNCDVIVITPLEE